MWEDGWKQRYYKTKFDVDVSDEDFRQKVVQSYVEGLCWVLRYYYQVRRCTRLPASKLPFGSERGIPQSRFLKVFSNVKKS